MHQVRALVSCIQPGLVICFTLDTIHVSKCFLLLGCFEAVFWFSTFFFYFFLEVSLKASLIMVFSWVYMTTENSWVTTGKNRMKKKAVLLPLCQQVMIVAPPGERKDWEVHFLKHNMDVWSGVTGEEKSCSKNYHVLLPMSNWLKALTTTHLVIGSSTPCV